MKYDDEWYENNKHNPHIMWSEYTTEELMGFIDDLMKIVGNYRDKPMNDDYTYQYITGTYKMFKHLQKQINKGEKNENK